MKAFRKLLPVLFVPLIILVSGCISGLDAETMARASPIVQDFLDEHPNAEILVTHYTEDQSSQMLEEIREECANPVLEAKEYYRIRFNDPDTGLLAIVWIDWDDKSVECAYKEGSLPGQTEECKPYAEARCYGQHVYWFDSCGYKQDKKEYCPDGCIDGRCINKKTCEEAGGYCIYLSTESVALPPPTSAAGLITGAPVGAISGCVKYYECPDGTKIRYCEEVKKFDDKGNYMGLECVCKEHPEYQCPVEGSTGETPDSFVISTNAVCDEGFHKTDNWCPDNGICCAPGTSDCITHHTYRCYGDHLYWFDSCGNKEEKKQECPYGCVENRCRIQELKQFCGTSTGGPCQTDDNCMTGGCSGQVCQSIHEDPVVTDCLWKECHDDLKYHMQCVCVEGKCRWKESESYGCGDGRCEKIDVTLIDDENDDLYSFRIYNKDHWIQLLGISSSKATIELDGQSKEVEEGKWYIIEGVHVKAVDIHAVYVGLDERTGLSVILGEFPEWCPEDCSDMCKDSDNGKEYFEKGTVTVGENSWSDHCNSDGTLTEKYCEGDEMNAVTVECGQGYECSDGKCVVQGCAEEGEQFSWVYTKEYPQHCCEGLTGWEEGMDTRISVADECYGTGTVSGNPVGRCIECGNQLCEAYENPCNCPEDCVGKGKSDYLTVDAFCDSKYDYYCESVGSLNSELCALCTGQACVDSDGGINENVSGYVSCEGETFYDYCKDELPYDTLIEYYCDGDAVKSKEIYCGHINCAEGMCLQRECYMTFFNDYCQHTVNIDGDAYIIELKGYNEQDGEAYFYVNGDPTSPYGWAEGNVYYIDGNIYAIVSDFSMLSYKDSQNNTVYYPSVAITLNEDCIKGCSKPCHGRLDPLEEIECCQGLDKTYEIVDAETTLGWSMCLLGFGEQCISCGDGTCDRISENRCNCPEDCDTGCTILLYNIGGGGSGSSYYQQTTHSVMIGGETYGFEYKVYDETEEKIYIYVNGDPTSPYGWTAGETYTITGTNINVQYKGITSFPASWNETILPDFFSAELYIDEACTHI